MFVNSKSILKKKKEEEEKKEEVANVTSWAEPMEVPWNLWITGKP